MNRATIAARMANYLKAGGYRLEGVKVIEELIKEALSEQLPEVPKGWKLVPVEITEEMSAAFMRMHKLPFHSSGESIYRPLQTWVALIKSAPEINAESVKTTCCHQTVLTRCKDCPY